MTSHDDLGGAVSFAHVWSDKIFRVLVDEYQRLLAAAPSRLQARVEKTCKQFKKGTEEIPDASSESAVASALDARVQEKMKEVLQEVANTYE